MFFCDHITKFKNHLKHQSLEKDLGYLVFDRTEDVLSGDWNAVAQGQNVFLDLEYLKILENTASKNLQSRYVIIYKNETPFAIAYFLRHRFWLPVFWRSTDLQVNI